MAAAASCAGQNSTAFILRYNQRSRNSARGCARFKNLSFTPVSPHTRKSGDSKAVIMRNRRQDLHLAGTGHGGSTRKWQHSKTWRFSHVLSKFPNLLHSPRKSAAFPVFPSCISCAYSVAHFVVYLVNAFNLP